MSLTYTMGTRSHSARSTRSLKGPREDIDVTKERLQKMLNRLTIAADNDVLDKKDIQQAISLVTTTSSRPATSSSDGRDFMGSTLSMLSTSSLSSFSSGDEDDHMYRPLSVYDKIMRKRQSSKIVRILPYVTLRLIISI